MLPEIACCWYGIKYRGHRTWARSPLKKEHRKFNSQPQGRMNPKTPPNATPVPFHLSLFTDKPKLISCPLTDLRTSLCQDIDELRRAPAPSRLDYIGRKRGDGVGGTCSLLRGGQRSVDACAQISTCAKVTSRIGVPLSGGLLAKTHRRGLRV